MIDIKFEECHISGYSERTRLNATADVTLAFAKDFNSTGEILTKKSVLQQKKLYLPIDFKAFSDIRFFDKISDETAIAINKLPNKYFTLNIAGNSLYTMRGTVSQKEIDDFVARFLSEILWKLRLLDDEDTKTITLIRSGGQTGFDEAGIKAGFKLGYETKVLCPKNFKFRTVDGIDIENEKLFKERFI